MVGCSWGRSTTARTYARSAERAYGLGGASAGRSELRATAARRYRTKRQTEASPPMESPKRISSAPLVHVPVNGVSKLRTALRSVEPSSVRVPVQGSSSNSYVWPPGITVRMANCAVQLPPSFLHVGGAGGGRAPDHHGRQRVPVDRLEPVRPDRARDTGGPVAPTRARAEREGQHQTGEAKRAKASAPTPGAGGRKRLECRRHVACSVECGGTERRAAIARVPHLPISRAQPTQQARHHAGVTRRALRAGRAGVNPPPPRPCSRAGHHRVPYASPGRDGDNVQPVCQHCNSKQTDIAVLAPRWTRSSPSSLGSHSRAAPVPCLARQHALASPKVDTAAKRGYIAGARVGRNCLRVTRLICAFRLVAGRHTPCLLRRWRRQEVPIRRCRVY